jgi:3-hydroxyisobutyrate dehydrogenase
VWNRSGGKAEPLTADGAYLARTPEDAANGAGIVITMLADEDAFFQAMDGPDGALGVLARLHRGSGIPAGDPHGPHHALWVHMSTIGEAATRRCAELANRSGVGFVDAPVLAGQLTARAG